MLTSKKDSFQDRHTHLAFYPFYLLFALEFFVESTHASSADAGGSKRLFYCVFSFIPCTCPCSILQTLAFIFSHSCFSFIASILCRVKIGICSFAGVGVVQLKSYLIAIEDLPALRGTSVIHCSSVCLFFPPRPHLFTHSCRSSSQTFLSRGLC
jgi:hypothetical protein